MRQILDHISAEPLLESVDDWQLSMSCQEWFTITRSMVQNAIADMDLDDAALSVVEDAFIGAGLL